LGQNLPQGDLGSMSGLPPRAAVERTSVDCPKSPILVIVAIRGTGGYGTSAAPYSGLMFAVRMTFAHFSVSPARNFPNSAGELGGSTNPPRSTRRALMAESDRLERAWLAQPDAERRVDDVAARAREDISRARRSAVIRVHGRCRGAPGGGCRLVRCVRRRARPRRRSGAARAAGLGKALGRI
jgi:hypothetical protein